MKKMKPCLLVAIVCFTACRSYDFEFHKNRSAYQQLVSCLRKNYSTLFTPKYNERSVSLYLSDSNVQNLCGSLKSLKEKEIEFIHLDKDSTVWIYARLATGWKATQHILMFNDKAKIDREITPDLELKKDYGGGWCEYERIVSIAD